MSASKEMELIYHKGTPGYHIPKGLFELMEFGIKQALSKIDEDKNTIEELRKTIEERDVTISSLHLSLGEAYERDTDNFCEELRVRP